MTIRERQRLTKGTRVLVTGAGGFLGQHLVRYLNALGAKVTAFLRYTGATSASQWICPQDTLIRGDLQDPCAVEWAVQNQDVIIHAGASISIPYSYEHPTEVFSVNAGSTLHLLNAMRALKRPPLLVLMSTSEVYGSKQTEFITEEHPLNPQSPYAASKVAAEALVRAYHLSYGHRTVTLRAFNYYGPGQSPRAVIPRIIQQALKGSVIELGDTTTERDFTYVGDIVDAVWRAGFSMHLPGAVMNVGSGQSHSIGAIVEQVGALMGRRLKVKLRPRDLRPRNSEVTALLCDAHRARALMGWSPCISFTEGLRETIQWWKDHV